ncbi:MAG: nodulation protein NfeD, partial [Dehalococcoidia bacterium]
SRAASAGTFITIAAHVAAMAPGTNIGAAHPVGIGGQKMDETMSEKVENDAAAYIRSLAEKRGRNAEWAEKAVRESVSISEKEALKLKVIDLIAPDLDGLLKAIDGKKVEIAQEKVGLQTQDKAIRYVEMSLRQRVLSFVSNPTVAYFLLMLGFYGLIFELSNPGVVLPGVVGGISLLLGLYALQMLPVNYAGLLLIVLAIIMFLAEIKVPSHGALTIGGIISMLLGSLMLIDSPAPYLNISLQVIISMTLATAVFFLLLVRAVVLVHRVRPATGSEWLLSATGVVMNWEGGSGKVFIRGELWNAQADGPFQEGQEVQVVGMDGLKLRIKNKEEG